MADELTTLQAIEQHGDLNPVQQTRLQELRTAGNNPGNPYGIESKGITPVANPGSGGALGMGTGGAPAFDLVAATNAAYNTPEIQAANTAITARQKALADAQAGINDNPLYSEATRVGKSAKLTEKANADILIQQNQLASLKSDAAIKLNAQQGQYNINEQAYQDRLSNFNNLVSMGGLDNAGAEDLAKLAVDTGIPMSMIQSIQALSKQKNTPQAEKPQIITATDNNGNLSILAVDANGKIINQTEVGGAGKAATYKGQEIGSGGVATGGGGAAADPKKQIAADKAAAPTSLTQDVKQNKMTLGTAMSLYQQYGMTKQKIYDIYVANTAYKQTAATKEADKERYGVK